MQNFIVKHTTACKISDYNQKLMGHIFEKASLPQAKVRISACINDQENTEMLRVFEK